MWAIVVIYVYKSGLECTKINAKGYRILIYSELTNIFISFYQCLRFLGRRTGSNFKRTLVEGKLLYPKLDNNLKCK